MQRLPSAICAGGSFFGFELDSSARDEAVKLVDWALADDRDTLKTSATSVGQLLDLFVKDGWSEALAFTFRLGEAFAESKSVRYVQVRYFPLRTAQLSFILRDWLQYSCYLRLKDSAALKTPDCTLRGPGVEHLNRYSSLRIDELLCSHLSAPT